MDFLRIKFGESLSKMVSSPSILEKRRLGILKSLVKTKAKKKGVRMQLYKFRTTATGSSEYPPIDLIRFVVANHKGEAMNLIEKNWSEMSFKRNDTPIHQLIGVITQETNGVFNETELVQVEN